MNFRLKDSVENIIEKIQECKCIEELFSLLVNAVEFDFMDTLKKEYKIKIRKIDRQSPTYNEKILAMLDEIEGDFFDDFYGDELPMEVLNKVKDSKKKLSEIKDLKDIKSVSVNEYYYGWGEFACDEISDFIDNAIPEELDWNDEGTVKETIGDRFAEDEIDSLIEQMKNGSISVFNADITTVLDMTTCKFEKNILF